MVREVPTLREQLRLRLDASGIEPNRLLGQHFLVDRRILNQITELSGLTEKTHVLEIGAGPGQFSDALAAVAKVVYAIEKDVRLWPLLNDVAKRRPNISVIGDDARALSFDDYLSPSEDSVVAANLPYYLTSELIVKCLIEVPFVRQMTFLLQKEAVERLLAKPSTKSYGPLSVMVNTYADDQVPLHVPSSAFLPPPQVGSRVLVLTRKASLDASTMASFHTFLQAVFSTRRKTLTANWKREIGDDTSFVVAWLKEHGYPSSIRAEALSPEALWSLFQDSCAV